MGGESEGGEKDSMAERAEAGRLLAPTRPVWLLPPAHCLNLPRHTGSIRVPVAHLLALPSKRAAMVQITLSCHLGVFEIYKFPITCKHLQVYQMHTLISHQTNAFHKKCIR